MPALGIAYNTSQRAVNTYRSRFGEENPLSLAAAVNHAIILRRRGERSSARRMCDLAYQALTDQVGRDHPYTRAAAIGVANDLVADGEVTGAVRLLRTTLETERPARADLHPDMLICAINLGLITREQDPQGATALIEPNLSSLRDALGSEHPLVLGAARGEVGECDIEPPPF